MAEKVRLYQTVQPSMLQEKVDLIETLFKQFDQGLQAKISIDREGFLYGRALDLQIGSPDPDKATVVAQDFFRKTNEIVSRSPSFKIAGIPHLFPTSLFFTGEEKLTESRTLIFELRLKPNREMDYVQVNGAEVEISMMENNRIIGFSIHCRPISGYKNVKMFKLVFPDGEDPPASKMFYDFTGRQTNIKPFFHLIEKSGISSIFPASIYSVS